MMDSFQKACEEFMCLFLIDFAFSSSSLQVISVREFKDVRTSSIIASIFAIFAEISSGTCFFCRFKMTIAPVRIPCNDRLSKLSQKRTLASPKILVKAAAFTKP